tara:strand:- start:1776 stop:2186 length:411 start_codon:yes stop_codon:yes gene_type:complete
MGIQKIHRWEKALIMFLNIDGWKLIHTGNSYESYDAKGKTPKGFDCVIEMKFRTKYYEEKMLEKYKYDSLMSLGKDLIKLYFVNDPKGNYMFYLNKLVLPSAVEMYCPDTTMWTKKRLKKPVYLLEENQASIINIK